MPDRPSTAHDLAIEYLKLYGKNDQPTPEEFAEQYDQIKARIEKALANTIPKATTGKIF
jgi:hypothetical protein